MFEELNTSTSIKTVRDGIDTEKMEFVSIKDFIGKSIKVDGFFFTKSKYGEQVVVVGEGSLINVPKRYTDTFKAIKNDPAKLNAVMEGKLTLGNIRTMDAKNGKTVAFDFIG